MRDGASPSEIYHDAQKARMRIGRRDSRREPVLAGADETPTLRQQKFFYCQSSRLRVRAHGFIAAAPSRHDIERALNVVCMNSENIGGESVFFNFCTRRYRSFRRFFHLRARLLLPRRMKCFARSHISLSTLP